MLIAAENEFWNLKGGRMEDANKEKLPQRNGFLFCYGVS